MGEYPGSWGMVVVHDVGLVPILWSSGQET